jgi:hypothetical protein
VEHTVLTLATRVLARPAALINEGDLATKAGPLVLLTLLGGAAFGAVVGTFHGGWQVALAALKMPLVLLLPIVVTLPALRAIHSGRGEPVPLRRAGLAALVGAARIAVLSTALLPVLWLAYSMGLSYRPALLLMAGGMVLTGLPGLTTIGRAVSPNGQARAGAVVSTVLLVGVVIAQTGWMLRPFVVTPGAQLTALCPITDDVFTGLITRVVGAPTEGASPWDCTP